MVLHCFLDLCTVSLLFYFVKKNERCESVEYFGTR